MEESFGERVRRLRLARQLSPGQLADKIGVSRPTVVMWESGASAFPESKNLVRAAEVLCVDPKYLQFGDGPIDAYANVPDAAVLMTRSGELRAVPIIGFAIATPGEDGYFDDMGFPPGGGEAYLPWPTRDPHAYALRVKGDSMQPRIRPGQIIVVEPSMPVSNLDDVVVRTTAGRKMVKQLLNRRAGEVTLGSINQAHRQLTISLEEIESIHFVAAIVSRGAATKEEP